MADRVHIRYDGRSEDFSLDELFPQDRLASIGIPEGTEVTFGNLTQDHVVTALAQHYDVSMDEFEDYAVIFRDGDITVRPKAEFGI